MLCPLGWRWSASSCFYRWRGRPRKNDEEVGIETARGTVNHLIRMLTEAGVKATVDFCPELDGPGDTKKATKLEDLCENFSLAKKKGTVACRVNSLTHSLINPLAD